MYYYLQLARVMYIFLLCLIFSEVTMSSFLEGITSFLGFTESCSPKWIPANISGLEHDLQKKVFGQPFVLSALIPVLKHHYSSASNNNKALAMSFHGSPGTGKNFVTELIAKNVFTKGFDSRYFHFFSGISDFSRNADVTYYKSYLANFIESKINMCEWSMFVFDETDKIPEGILEVVKSYIDNGKRKDGVDFRNAIYIFLSNTGETHIIDKNIALWKDSVPRHNFKLKEFQDILFAATFNEQVHMLISEFTQMSLNLYKWIIQVPHAYDDEYSGGLKYSTAVRSALINLYLPFLPLEKIHVEKCIATELKRQNLTADEHIIKNVLADLDFGPPPENIFASHGCKQIETKVVLQVAMQDNKKFKFYDEL